MDFLVVEGKCIIHYKGRICCYYRGSQGDDMDLDLHGRIGTPIEG